MLEKETNKKMVEASTLLLSDQIKSQAGTLLIADKLDALIKQLQQEQTKNDQVRQEELEFLRKIRAKMGL